MNIIHSCNKLQTNFTRRSTHRVQTDMLPDRSKVINNDVSQNLTCMKSHVSTNNLCFMKATQGQFSMPPKAPDTDNVFKSKGSDRSISKKDKLSNSRPGTQKRIKVGGCNHRNIGSYFTVRRPFGPDIYDNPSSKRKADS